MSKNNIETCVELLQRAKTDNERFASLMMVAKVVRSEECSESDREVILEAVGFDFPIRLLKSKSGPEDCPAYTYPALAVMVLSAMCSSPSLRQLLSGNRKLAQLLTSTLHLLQVVAPKLLAAVPHFNELICTNYVGEEAAAMYGDCYDCLTCIASRQEGGAAMLKHHTVTALCRVISTKAIGSQRAYPLLTYLMHEWGAAIWRDNGEALRLLLQTLTAEFCEQKDQDKFDTCQTLHSVLLSTNQEQVEAASGEWIWNMYDTLAGILQSKLGAAQRDPALCLCSVMVERVGVTWALGVKGDKHRIFLLMVHLTCIEVRMILEDSEFPEVCKKSNLLSACYSLLEQVISYLTCGPSLGLEQRQVSQLHAALVGAFNAVMYFLGTVEQECADQMLAPVVVASVRVLGAWIAEETTALKKEVLARLPFLIKVCRSTFEEHSVSALNQPFEGVHLSSSEGAMQDDKTEAANPVNDSCTDVTTGSSASRVDSTSADVTTESSTSRVDSTSADVTERIPSCQTAPTDVIKFLLPGLCHLTAEDQARAVLLQEGIHQLLMSYMLSQWTRLKQAPEREQAEMSLTTLCGIFLNLLVLEKELTASHHTFTELLRFIFDKAPELKSDGSQLVLHMNLCVLGLMLLQSRQQECMQFLADCTCLLRRAHVLEEMGDGEVRVRVADAYVPYWDSLEELWLLGMQAVAGLIPRYPVLVEEIVRVGWMNQITALLSRKKGSTSVDSEDQVLACYTDLMRSLAEVTSQP